MRVLLTGSPRILILIRTISKDFSGRNFQRLAFGRVSLLDSRTILTKQQTPLLEQHLHPIMMLPGHGINTPNRSVSSSYDHLTTTDLALNKTIRSVALLPPDYEPGNWDVVCQRGKDCHEHGAFSQGSQER